MSEDPDAGSSKDDDDAPRASPLGAGDKDSPSKPPTDPDKALNQPGAEWPEQRPVRSRLRSQFGQRPPTDRGRGTGGGGGDSGGASAWRRYWRFVVYGLFLLYLAGDLLVFRGPLKQQLESRRAFTATAAEKAVRYQWVASVNGEPITTVRLDRAVDIHLYQRGKTREDVSDGAMRHVRGAVLQKLIDDLLVEQHAAGRNHTVSEEQVDAAVARFESQFKDRAILERRSAGQQLDSAQRRELLRQLAIQTDWLESQLATTTQVTEATAREWFEANRASGIANGFGVEEAVRARHLFISTAVDDSPEKEQRIRKLHRQLTVGPESAAADDDATESQPVDFAELAARHSEDQRSKPLGGDLNWFTRARMPSEFFDAIDGLALGDISAPFRTPLGWHIVQVTERKPAREASFEELRDEIIAYLESEDRRQKIEEFLIDLRRASTIQVFPEQL